MLVSADLLVQAIVTGLVLGGIYAVVATGLSLIWGTIRVLNFAHGAIFTMAGFMWVTGFYFWQLPYAANVVLAIGVAAALGAAIQGGVVRPILRQRVRPDVIETAVIIATLAAAIVLENTAWILWGPRMWLVPRTVEGSAPLFGSVRFPYHDMVIIAVGVIALIVLWTFLKRTKMGMAMRAVALDKDASLLMGISFDKVYYYTFIAGAALAGLAAVLLGSKIFINPYVGVQPLLIAFVVIVIGGLGNLKGTIAGAFLIGLVDPLTSTFIALSWVRPVTFAIVILVLIIRPAGIFGAKELS